MNATPTSSTVFASGDSAWSLGPTNGLTPIGLTFGSLPWRTGQWYHVAYTRNGNTHRLYRDGTLVSNTSNATTFTFSNVSFGTQLNGFMSEIRISDFARYTSNSFSLQTVPYYPLTPVTLLKFPIEPVIRYTADTIGQADGTTITTWNGLTATGSPTFRNIGGFSYIQFNNSSDSIPTQTLPAEQVVKFGTNGGGTLVYMFCLSQSTNQTTSIINFGTGTANTTYTSEYLPNLNSWTLVIINISGTSYSIYINNTLQSTGTLSSPLTNTITSTLGFDIGVTSSFKHHGIAVIDRSLTTGEMTDVYNSVSSIIGTNL